MFAAAASSNMWAGEANLGNSARYFRFAVDMKEQSLNFLNRDFADWSTHYAKPYVSK